MFVCMLEKLSKHRDIPLLFPLYSKILYRLYIDLTICPLLGQDIPFHLLQIFKRCFTAMST